MVQEKYCQGIMKGSLDYLHEWRVLKIGLGYCTTRERWGQVFCYDHDYGNILFCWPGSSVGITTELRTGRSGIESRWGRNFPPVQTDPGAHPASCKMGTGSFPGVKCGRGVLLTTYPLLVPRSWKSRAIPLPTLWATPGLQRNHFTFTFTFFNILFHYCLP